LNEQALSLFEDMGERERQESVLWQLATAMEWAGNYSGARTHHQTRLTLLSPEDTLEIARVNHDLGRLTFIAGDYDQAIHLLTDAIEIYRAAADSQLIAHGLLDLAIAEYMNADGAGALQHLEECIRLLQVLQDDYGLAIAVVNRGRAEQVAGEFGQAQMTLEQSLESADRLGDASLRAIALYGLGTNAAALGQWGDAASHLQAAAVLPQQIGDRRRLAEIIERMAQVALGRGETETAALLLGRAQTERLESGTTVPPAHRERHEEAVEAAEHALGAERFSVLIDEGKRRDIDELLHLVPGVAGQESA
jgi:tetratricopeptide (TPR) repeat protein